MIRRRVSQSVDAETAEAMKHTADAVYELSRSIPFLEGGEEPYARISAICLEVKLSIGRAFAIKDALKEKGYTFDGYTKMWSKTFTAAEVDAAIIEAKSLEALKVKLVK